jgi:dsRNA-specific ribonuclease
MANLPPLPKIEGDVELLLDVFTHKSLRMTGAPLNEDYGDTDRLAELGAYVLQMVVATHWFHAKNPSLPADQLSVSPSVPIPAPTSVNAHGIGQDQGVTE